MTIQRDKIIVVDIEATCWQGNPPPGEQNEIIEIGLCLFDTKTRESSGKRSILVKPQCSKVSEFCTQLTTLTQEQVDSGVPFDIACAILETDYEAKAYLWGSWGNYDRKIFERQCQSFGVCYPFSKHHVNIKKLFARYINHKKSVGMTRALEMIQLKLDGTHHRGHDDAWNISRILAHLLTEYGRDILLPYW